MRHAFPPVSISILFWVLVGLNFADYGLTSAIIDSGGSEANPYVNAYIARFGVIGILIAKLIPIFILFFAMYFKWDRIRPHFQIQFKRALHALNFMYSCIILYSITVLIALLT